MSASTSQWTVIAVTINPELLNAEKYGLTQCLKTSSHQKTRSQGSLNWHMMSWKSLINSLSMFLLAPMLALLSDINNNVIYFWCPFLF